MVELERQNLSKNENGQETSPADSGMSSVSMSPAPNQQGSDKNGTGGGGVALPPTSSASTSTNVVPNSPTSPSKAKKLDASPTSKQTVVISRRAVATPPPGPLIYTPKENEFGQNFKILPVSCQIRELQTIIRDKNTSRSDFKFYADRLIRLVIEDSLNLLPFRRHEIMTPTGSTYDGLKYERGNCGVSIVRSGESMEAGLRDCCRSIRIGKILVESDADTHEAHVVYARFPDDIQLRKVLLMYPIMSTGNTVIKSVNVLKEHLVHEENIILANLFCTPAAVRTVLSTFPNMKILTSEVHPIAPNHFGQRYFGTD
ncbi:Uracil phosphoribosyltransferase [Orchesella cincta]|uniref:Uracil phosphoribosyltransferase homolog n=1 Tax=Orchesella cincta TaxID=48709 RepID=A0A1D2NM59_ORCCI|nr:Uracil phosphoribosyltransferase [Orchesella cincta]